MMEYVGVSGSGMTLVPRKSSSMSDEILTIREVASFLKLADKTVYSMAQQAELPAFKVRGQWRIRRVDFDAWLQRRTEHGESREGATRKDEGEAG